MDARAHRLTLINSIIGVTIAGMSTRVFMISVPTLATALGTDILGISWALIVYQMAGIGLGVICGRLGDIYGHRKMFGSGMGIMAVGSLLCGLSQDVFQLILFRFIQGVGGAMIQSSGRTLAFRAMPAGSEGKAQGLMAMSHQFGFFIGPPIGGLIIDLVHWRGIFFLLFVPSLVGMALCFMTGRSVAASASQRQPIDYRGASIFLGLTVLVTLLLDQKIAEVLGRSMQSLLAVIFAGAL
jgi:MFS family permease